MGRGRILVPPEISRIPQGVWLHAACRPRALVVCNAIGHLSRVSVPLLRRGLEDWQLPIGEAEWDDWLRSVSALTGATSTTWLVMPAPDEHRARFSVVLLDAQLRQTAYARWTLNPAKPLAIRAERELTERPPSTFRHPPLLETGVVDGWTYTLSAPLPTGPHRPAKLAPNDRRSIVSEIQRRLAHLVPAGEVAIHGDFTPWNVRAIRDDVVVIDWEQFGVGPPAADEVWHVVTGVLATGGDPSEAVSRVRSELTHHAAGDISAAATFWRRRETDAQPEEVDEHADRSSRLLEFEARISAALQGLE